MQPAAQQTTTHMIPSWVIFLFKILNCALGVGLVVIAIFGFKDGLETFDETAGVQLWLMSVYLILFAILMIFAEMERPQIVIQQFNFLKSSAGRGLFYMFIGSSVIIQGKAFESAEVFGSMALCTGFVSLIFACPCFEIPKDIVIGQKKPDPSQPALAVETPYDPMVQQDEDYTTPA